MSVKTPAREIQLTFTAVVRDRMAEVIVNAGGMMFTLKGPVSYDSDTETLFDGQLIYFPATKTVSFELSRKTMNTSGLDAQGNVTALSVNVETITGSLLPDVADAAKTIQTTIQKEFPIIGPAIMVALRRYFE